jgi:hypothetical protein
MAERLSPEEANRKTEIASALNNHGVSEPCPRCRTNNFTIAGESAISITERPGFIHISGYAIPVVFVVCDKCGYVAQHAKKVLGLS